MPLLANDPHLGLQLPANWSEARLIAPGLDVYGCSLPCVPGVILGHNRGVAWGFTNSGVDVQDLFIERFNERGEYEFREEWFVPERIRAGINIQGEPDVVEEVISTRPPAVHSSTPPLPD